MAYTPAPKDVVCPICGLSDQVEKVSTIYMAGIADRRSPDIASLTRIPAQKLSPLSRLLKPPSGKSSTLRPIHPDTMLIFFSCMLPIFLIGILKDQPFMVLPVLLILACLYGLYFFTRKGIIAKFERQQNEQKQTRLRVERAVKTWMKLYYCTRDEGVFLPGEDELIPADQMTSFLMQIP
jgi:hypothetical protein